MSVSLSKGGNVSLEKVAPGLTKIVVGLGWDARSTDGTDFDLDASLFELKADGKVRGESDFIFYNNPRSVEEAIVHTGDNRTGAGEGDDEQILVDLAKVPAEITKLTVAVTIHEADARKQSFGQVSAAFIRVLNGESNEELARYDLSEDASTETAMVFGEIYRNNTDWKFRAVGQGYNGGLGALIKQFGLE